jgi:hypothetical protein
MRTNFARLQRSHDTVGDDLGADAPAGALPAKRVHRPPDGCIAQIVDRLDGPGIPFTERKAEQRPRVGAGGQDCFLGPAHLLHDLCVTESGETGMGHGVVAHAVPCGDNLPDAVRIVRGPVPSEEECSGHSFG